MVEDRLRSDPRVIEVVGDENGGGFHGQRRWRQQRYPRQQGLVTR